MSALTLCSRGGFSWRTINAAFESGIALAALAAVCHFDPLTVIGQITDQLAGVDIMNHCATRHMNIQVLTGLSSHISAGATSPAFRPKLPGNAKICQCVD